MTLAFSALVSGVILFVSGVKGWSINEFFSKTRPTGTSGFSGEAAIPGVGQILPPNSGAATVPGVGDVTGANAGLLVKLGFIAQDQFGLNVHECSAPGAPSSWGPVHRVHVPTSLHYSGRAFDASGTNDQMRAYANYADANYGTQLTELFWNGPGCVNRKNGKRVPCGFVAGHRDHVHTGI